MNVGETPSPPLTNRIPRGAFVNMCLRNAGTSYGSILAKGKVFLPIGTFPVVIIHRFRQRFFRSMQSMGDIVIDDVMINYEIKSVLQKLRNGKGCYISDVKLRHI